MWSRARIGGQAAFDAAIFEIVERDGSLRFEMASTPATKFAQILLLGRQHLFGKHGARQFEHAAEEMVHEQRGDAIAEAAGQYFAAFVLEVFHLFEIAVVDQELRFAFVDAHPAPEFGHQHAVVVIHPIFRADVTGGGGEAAIAGDDRTTRARC